MADSSQWWRNGLCEWLPCTQESGSSSIEKEQQFVPFSFIQNPPPLSPFSTETFKAQDLLIPHIGRSVSFFLTLGSSSLCINHWTNEQRNLVALFASSSVCYLRKLAFTTVLKVFWNWFINFPVSNKPFFFKFPTGFIYINWRGGFIALWSINTALVLCCDRIFDIGKNITHNFTE